MPEFTSLIRDLCASDFAKREIAANEIYKHGAIRVQSAIEEWLADPGFAVLVLPSKNAPIRLTVGIAVEPATFDSIRAASGSPLLAKVATEYHTREFELNFPGDVQLDVLTTGEPPGCGAIAKYLQKYGEGIQQIEIDVIHVERATQILRARFGLEAVFPAAREGADRSRVNFFLVPDGRGRKLLVELVERESR
jgi:hypothetical protein